MALPWPQTPRISSVILLHIRILISRPQFSLTDMGKHEQVTRRTSRKKDNRFSVVLPSVLLQHCSAVPHLHLGQPGTNQNICPVPRKVVGFFPLIICFCIRCFASDDLWYFWILLAHYYEVVESG